MKIEVDQNIITAVGEGLQELALRLEIEAAALAMVNTREGTLRASELLERAETVQESANFFLHL